MALVPLFMRKRLAEAGRRPAGARPAAPAALVDPPVADADDAARAEQEPPEPVVWRARRGAGFPDYDDTPPATGGVETAVAAAPPAKPARRARLTIGPQPETVPVMARLSNLLGLWKTCPGARCKRMRACSDLSGAPCLREQRETVGPHLEAIRRLAGAGSAWRPAEAPPAGPPRRRDRRGRVRRGRSVAA